MTNHRPTSPHITIYRKQISSVLSILHRITGAGLFITVLLIIWNFVFWVFNKFDDCCLGLLKHGLFKPFMILVTFAYFYHLYNGLRHLIWDSGRWFSIDAINVSGWVVVIFSSLITILFWTL